MFLLRLLLCIFVTKKVLSEQQCFEIQDCQSLSLLIQNYEYNVITDNWQDRSEICPLSDASVSHWVISVQTSDTEMPLKGTYCSRGLELDPNMVCIMNNNKLIFTDLGNVLNQMGTFDIMFNATDINYSAEIPIDYAPTGVYSLYMNDDDTVYYYPGDDRVPLSWRIYHDDPIPDVTGVFFEGANVIDADGFVSGPEPHICLATFSGDRTQVYTLLLINPTTASAGEYTLVAGTYSHVQTLAIHESYSILPVSPTVTDLSSPTLTSPTDVATDEPASFTDFELIITVVVVTFLACCLIIALIITLVCVIVYRSRRRQNSRNEENGVNGLYSRQFSVTNGHVPPQVRQNGHLEQNGNVTANTTTTTTNNNNTTTTTTGEHDPAIMATDVACNGHAMSPGTPDRGTDDPNGVTPPPITTASEQSRPSTETTDGQPTATDNNGNADISTILKEISENTKEVRKHTERMANAAEQQRDIQLDLLDVNRNMSENMEIHTVAVSSDQPEEDTGFVDPPTQPSIPDNHPDTADSSQSSIHDSQSPPPLINDISFNIDALNLANCSDADTVERGVGGGDDTSLELETSTSAPAIVQLRVQENTAKAEIDHHTDFDEEDFLQDAVFDREPRNPEFHRWVGKHIISEWKMFGSLLGLSDSDLSAIESENSGYRVTKVLDAWERKSETPFTWRNVIRALYDQGINNVAEGAVKALRAQSYGPVN